VSLEPLRDRLALDQLHDEEVPVAVLLHPVERRNVGVVERGENLRLALEARDAFGVGGKSFGEDLDGDLAPELRVSGAIDLTHAARAQHGNDFVLTRPRVLVGCRR